VQAAAWKTFPDVKFCGLVGGKIVFDIKGNDFRLIAIASFEDEKLYIRQILTHEDYSKGNWKK
jgi:mRNA interferase HigB